MFFFLGRTRRQKLLRLQGENIWNLFPMGMMIRLLQDSGFKVEGIEYFVGKRRNYWMLLPSIFLYPFQLAYIVFSGFAEKYNLKGDLKFKMYPFRSMYCTHYVVVCRKSSDIWCRLKGAPALFVTLARQHQIRGSPSSCWSHVWPC